MTYINDRGGVHTRAGERTHGFLRGHGYKRSVAGPAMLQFVGPSVEAPFGCDILFHAKTGNLAVTTIVHAEQVLTTPLMCATLNQAILR